MKTIVIDSRDKISGTNTNFTIQLNQEIISPRKGTLLFANLPTANDNVESYFLVKIQEFGIAVQSGSPNGFGTFIVPVTSGSGFRNIHQLGTIFFLLKYHIYYNSIECENYRQKWYYC